MSLSIEIKKRLGSFTLESAFETSEPVTGLLGASGCGKSITLKCIAGIVQPDEGRIILDGVTLFDSAAHINLPPQKRQVGYLFQNYALFPNMTVEQNILAGLRWEKNATVRQKALADSLTLLKLNGLEKRHPSQLSGGQAQRVALARMLVAQPRLLLLDEPFSALDTHLRDTLQPQLKALLRQVDRQALLVTHSRDEAYRLCSRICVMDRGRILKDADTQTVFADPGSVAAARITGCKNIIQAEKAGQQQVLIPAWGITLNAGRPVPDGLTAIGLRAHSFQLDGAVNRFSIRWEQELEELFDWCLLFRFEGQDEDTEPIWWRLPKADRPSTLPATLTIPPEEILLLTHGVPEL